MTSRERVTRAMRRQTPDRVPFDFSHGFAPAIRCELERRAGSADLSRYFGVDILNPVQSECMDPAALKRQYGDRLSLWGTIGAQSTLPCGTPADVRREVQARMETAGQGGGLFLAPTHMIEPDVPVENIMAFVEAVQELGRYI